MQDNPQNNFIPLTPQQLDNMLRNAARMGAIEALASVGVVVNDLKTRAEMCRLHGKARIDHLISDGRLTPRRVDGESRIRYSEKQYQSLIQ